MTNETNMAIDWLCDNKACMEQELAKLFTTEYRSEIEKHICFMELAISALREQVKEPCNNDWISVKDRLPEDLLSDKERCKRSRITVLTTTRSGRVSCTSRVQYGKYGGNIARWEWNEYKSVTHWQPLPEPPESEDC